MQGEGECSLGIDKVFFGVLMGERKKKREKEKKKKGERASILIW